MSTVKFCVRCKIIAKNSSVKSTDFIKWRLKLSETLYVENAKRKMVRVC